MIRKLMILSVILGALVAAAFTVGAATPAETDVLFSAGSFESFAPEAFTGTAGAVCIATNEAFQACMAECLAVTPSPRLCVSQCLFVPCDE